MELKTRAEEDIIYYDIRVKHTQEAALHDTLTAEQSRILYIIPTANNAKFTDECLKQFTMNIEGLKSANVWQKTHDLFYREISFPFLL